MLIDFFIPDAKFAERGCISDDVLVVGAPAAPPSSAAKPGAVGEHCLSAQRELRSRPAWRATQGTHAVGGAGGTLLFGYSFLGQARKSNCPAGAWPALNKARSAPSQKAGHGL